MQDASVGNLDRCCSGDVSTSTIAEIRRLFGSREVAVPLSRGRVVMFAEIENDPL